MMRGLYEVYSRLVKVRGLNEDMPAAFWRWESVLRNNKPVLNERKRRWCFLRSDEVLTARYKFSKLVAVEFLMTVVPSTGRIYLSMLVNKKR